MNAVIVHVPTQREAYLKDLSARTELRGFRAGAKTGAAVKTAVTNTGYAGQVGYVATKGASVGFFKGFMQGFKGE